MMNTKFAQKVVKTFASRGLSAGGTFALTYTLGVLLGVYQTGLFMTGLSLLMGMKVIGCFGMESAILRFGGIHWGNADLKAVSEHFMLSVVIGLAISVVISIPMYLAAHWISVTVFTTADLLPVVHAVAIGFPLLVLSLLISAWLKAFGIAEVSCFFELGILSLYTAIALWILHFLGHPLSGALAMQWMVGILMVNVVVGFMLIYWEGLRPVATITNSRQFFGSISDYFVIDFIFYITQWGAVVFLGHFVDSAAVGIFALTYRITYTVNFILLVFENITAPRFAHMYSENNIAGMRQLAVNTTRYMSIFAAPILLVLIFFPKPVLSLFGDGFEAGALCLVVVALGQFVNVVCGPTVYILNMAGYQKTLRNICGISALIGVVGYLLIVPWLGSLGAAMVIFMTLAYQNISAALIVNKNIDINIFSWWLKIIPLLGTHQKGSR